MPEAKEFLERLAKINIHEIGDKKCLRRLCDLRLEFSPSGPSDLGGAYRFMEESNARIAEVLGLDTDTEFESEDLREMISFLNQGMEIETIARMFVGASIP